MKFQIPGAALIAFFFFNFIPISFSDGITTLLRIADKCHGKPTTFIAYKDEKLPLFYPCLIGVTKNKYCQFRCVSSKIGYIREDGCINYEYMKEEFNKHNFFKNETMNVYQIIADCTQGRCDYGSEANSCESARELYYCFYNRFAKVCGLHRPPKNILERSDEDTPVENVAKAANALVLQDSL